MSDLRTRADPVVAGISKTVDFTHVPHSAVVKLTDVHITCATLQQRQVCSNSWFTTCLLPTFHICANRQAWQIDTMVATALRAAQIPSNLPLALPSLTVPAAATGEVSPSALPVNSGELGSTLACRPLLRHSVQTIDAAAAFGWHAPLRPLIHVPHSQDMLAASWPLGCDAVIVRCCWPQPLHAQMILARC